MRAAESPFSSSGVYALKAEPPRDAHVHHSDAPSAS
jgi:hypothetical protein